LATAVKFPANYQDSPYSILASGVVTCLKSLSLPFSLILDEPLDSVETRGLNRVIPGWVLRENVYLLLRNEMKFSTRTRPGVTASISASSALKLWKNCGKPVSIW